MAKHKKLGLYWGEDALSFVELNKDAPISAAAVPFAPLQNDPMVGAQDLTQDVRLLESIQMAYQAGRFSTTDTYLSLPSKDIISRWFVIPWMKPQEMQGVVAFEAVKYIPFPLEELIYTYHPTTFSNGGVRQIGISFVGMRKSVYEGYINVLKQAGLNVVYSEPGAVSLLRALVVGKAIKSNEVHAVLKIFQDDGELFIASDGQVKFIRDFKLTTDQPQGDMEESLIQAKLFNEVRMSLDFFARQQGDINIKSVIVLSSSLNREMWDGLGTDLGLPVQMVDYYALLKNANSPEIGHIHAFGAALSGRVSSVLDLNLSEDSEASEKKSEAQVLIGSSQRAAAIVGLAALVIVVCVVTSLLAFNKFSKQRNLWEQESQEMGGFVNDSYTTIQQSVKKKNEKLKALKSLEFQSSVTGAFASFLNLIPDGIWLEKLNYTFTSTQNGTKMKGSDKEINYEVLNRKVKLEIAGLAYLDDSNVEFKTVNNFAELLQNDKEFQNYFKTIKIGDLKSQTMQDFKVTSFSLICE